METDDGKVNICSSCRTVSKGATRVSQVGSLFDPPPTFLRKCGF